MLLAAALVAATFFWIGRRDAQMSGPPELIQAPPGPYKIKPPNPGGLDVAGESETAFETSAGEDKDAQLDMSKAAQAGRAAQGGAQDGPAQRDQGAAAGAARSPRPSRRARPEA